ncbi:hypothetical protein BLNAU_8733 [Blattamonas nauphoetae]|uniref:Uncharacterized protein n=1 Tax=Blattamonas nauphoetae TaxID=2049346 RepID=A0ABQ9XY05_9EUKA|nr:hypothetical protein BLNAU_8733 [Blattamonas nauphoetae]
MLSPKVGQIAIQHHLQPARKVNPKWFDMSLNSFLRSTPKWVNSLPSSVTVMDSQLPNGMEKQPTSIIDQPLNGQEVSSTSSTDNEHPRGFSIKSTSVNVEPQNGSALVPASTSISSVEVTMEVFCDNQSEIDIQSSVTNAQPPSGHILAPSSMEMEKEPPGEMEVQSASFDDQPPDGSEIRQTSPSIKQDHPNESRIQSTETTSEPQDGAILLLPTSTSIENDDSCGMEVQSISSNDQPLSGSDLDLSSMSISADNDTHGMMNLQSAPFQSEPRGGSDIITGVPSDHLNWSTSPSKPQSTVSARGREWMAEKVRALKSPTSPQHDFPSPENEPKKAVIRTSRRRRRRQKHHDRKPFSEYLPIDPSQGQVLEESLALEQTISPHRGIISDVVCEDVEQVTHSESIPSATAMVPLNNQNTITDQSLINSALLWVERRSFDPSRRQLEKRHSLFQNDVEESFDPLFLRKALRSVVSLPFEYFRPNLMEPVIPEPPPLAPIVEEPPDGPTFQDGPPLLATLQALMKERDRQTAWIFPPDDPSGDDCSDTEYVPDDDDPLNCLVKEPAYLTDQPNPGLQKRVSIESVEKTVEETNTITLTQSGVELTISQNRKKTVKKSVERPVPTTLIDPAHVDDIERLRHAIDPSTGMINLANVENPVWDFITVPPPDNPKEVTFEDFYDFPSHSQPVNETPVVSPNEPKLGEVSPRPREPRFTICLDDSSEECPAEESSESDPSESAQIGAIDMVKDQARQWARQAWKVASRLNNEQLHRILRNKGQKQSETQFISTLISSRNSIKKLERVAFCPFSALLPRIGQVPHEGLSLSFPTSSIMSISDDELTTLCQESDTKTLNGFKAKDTIFSLPPPSKQPGQTPKPPRGSIVGRRGPLPQSKRGQPMDGPPSVTPSMAGTQMPSRQDRDTNLILANLKGQTALPTVERHLLPPPLRTISNKKIDVEALDGVEYSESLGYVFWDEDDTTKHLNAASQLLNHHFAKIAQLLAERDVNFENVDNAVWRLSATPYVLKTKKPKKPKEEQPFQWKPPTEETSESPRLGRAEKKKIETLVAKGKPSRALKELSKVIHPVPEIPFEDMVQTIQALHNADDTRQLTLQDLGEPREGWDLERENVEIQLQRLNSNSTASLDGITAELLKRSATHLKPVSALIGAVISECLEKGFVPTAWCLVRMVGIPKAKGGVRPISVQHSLKKLMARVLLQRNRQCEHGLQLNPAKTVAVSILDGQISTAPFGLMGSTITPTTSMHLLGTLLTKDQNERDQMFLDKVKKSDDLMPFLGLLSHQAHLLLLRQCINVRLLHLLRTLPISGHVLRRADDLLIAHLLTFFHLPQSNSILIHANVEDGGLGFSSFAGSNIPSLVHAMTSRRPFLWQTNPNPSGAPFQLGQEPPSSTFSPLQTVISVISMLNPDQFEKARRGQGKMVRLLEKDKLTQWRDPLPDWAKNRHATIRASRAHFWVTMMPVDKFHVLDNDTILNSLNYRMLKEPTSYELGKTLLDKQGRNLNYSVPCPICSVQFRVDHASCCQLNGSARTARHTTIKLWLNRLLQQIPNVVTELEKPVWMDGINLGTKPRPAGAIADIRVTITTQVSNHKFVTNLLQGGDRSGNTLTFGLDLTIAQDIPNALHRGLLLDPRAAVNQAEEGKFRHYKKLGQEYKVIGIGISENGQLGDNMELFLDFMKKVARDGHKSAQVYHFLQMTSLVLEQSRCIMERRVCQKLTWSLQNYSVQQDAQNGLDSQPSPSTTYLLSAVNLPSQQPNLALPPQGPNRTLPSQGPLSTSPSSSPPSGPPQVPLPGPSRNSSNHQLTLNLPANNQSVEKHTPAFTRPTSITFTPRFYYVPQPNSEHKVSQPPLVAPTSSSEFPSQHPIPGPSEGSTVIMTSTSPEEHIVETMERDSSNHELAQSGDNDLSNAGMEVDRSDSDVPISGPNLENPMSLTSTRREPDSTNFSHRELSERRTDEKPEISFEELFSEDNPPVCDFSTQPYFGPTPIDIDATQQPLQGSTQKDADVGQEMIAELPLNDAEVVQDIIFGLPPTDVNVDHEPTPGLIPTDAKVSQMPPPGLTLTDIDIDIEPSLEQITFGSDTPPTSPSHPPSCSPNPIPGSSQPTRTPPTQIPGSSQPTRTPPTQIPPSAVRIELDSDDDHNDPGQPQNGSKRKTFVDLTIDEEVTSHKCPSKGNFPPRTLRPKRKIPNPKQDDGSLAPNFARPKRARYKKQVPRTGRRTKSTPPSSFSSSCDDSLSQEDDPTWAPDSPRMDPPPKCRGRPKTQPKAGARKQQPPDGSRPVVRETGAGGLNGPFKGE